MLHTGGWCQERQGLWSAYTIIVLVACKVGVVFLLMGLAIVIFTFYLFIYFFCLFIYLLIYLFLTSEQTKRIIISLENPVIHEPVAEEQALDSAYCRTFQ